MTKSVEIADPKFRIRPAVEHKSFFNTLGLDGASMDIIARPMFGLFLAYDRVIFWLHWIGLNLALGSTVQDRCDRRVHQWLWRPCGVSACGQMRVMPLADLLPVDASLLAHLEEHGKLLSYLHAASCRPCVLEESQP
jgi:hypothetical protein